MSAVFESIVIAAMAVTFILVWRAHARRVAQRLAERWPPIDDDEFLRRCSPGTQRETALRVRRVLSHQLGIPYENVYPEQSFVELEQFL